MQYFPFILLILMAIALIVHNLTIFLHELGHAIPAILLTKQKVTIYLGSHGNSKNSVRIRIGLLEMWVKYNFFWRRGLCKISATELSYDKQIIYILCGPITSFIIAIASTYVIFGFDLSGFLKLIVVFFLGFAIIDLLVNLIPSNKPIMLQDGDFGHNDGYSLRLLFHLKRFSIAVGLYKNKEYEKAAILFEHFLTSGINIENSYRFAISSLINVKKYERALELHEKFDLEFIMTSDDYSNSAIIKSYLGFKTNEDYDKSLLLNPDNHYCLNNKAYFMTEAENYSESIPLFDKAIMIDPNFSYPYNNRGLARIKTGDLEGGLQDIERSIELEPNNAQAYRNLGIYYLLKNNKTEASRMFKKSKSMDASTHLIDNLIKDASA